MKRALVLEDVRANFLLIKAYLEAVGFDDFVWVTTIAAAREIINTQPPANFGVVILDIMLPDGEATSLAAEAKRRGFDTVCAYSARCSVEDQQEYLSVGFDHILPKPLPFTRVSAVFNPPVAVSGTH